MKQKPSFDKLRGGFYTPEPIAAFLTEWAIKTPRSRVLEPSCGDGVFLHYIIGRLIELGAQLSELPSQMYAVELIEDELEKARERISALGYDSPGMNIYTGDFFSRAQQWHRESVLFDVILGNPPFIRYQNFPEEHRGIAFRLMRSAGLNPNRLTNAWAPFLIASSILLKENGRLAMVIPAELFQVNYAAETRKFLSDYYSSINIITFRKLVFKCIQQEVILLLAERNGDNDHGIRTFEVDDLAGLTNFSHGFANKSELKPIDHASEKWTKYFLETDEILLLRSLRTHPALVRLGEVLDVDVGVVTGQNSFFVINEEQKKKFQLNSLPGKYFTPVVTRTPQLKGIIYTGREFENDRSNNKNVFLLTPPSLEFGKLPKILQAHIRYGEQNDYHQGYKCRIRKYWYIVPSVWVPDAFVLRQVNTYPRIVLNETDATTTDTIHRARFLEGVDGKRVITAFINSLTFAFSEITGRSYGGGVMTFEPTEIERLPLPLIGSENLDTSRVDSSLRAGNIETILDENDRLLLKTGLGLSQNEIDSLRDIWKKLKDRRLARKSK